MIKDISVNTQSSIKVISDKIIYFDPFKITEETHDADYVFITHDHYDHYEVDSIKKVMKDDTYIIFPDSMFLKVVPLFKNKDNLRGVIPNEEYVIDVLSFKTIPSYNLNKDFHPFNNKWVGYVLDLEEKLLVSGDTDATEELLNTKCDIACIPIGGTYTMTKEEAAEAINHIKPNIVIPTHYGSIVGNKNDGIEFSKLLDEGIECQLKLD